MALVAAAITPPGKSVVNSVRDVVGREKVVGVANAHRELVRLPAPGRLLLDSAAGTWIVQANGSRRPLGRYRMASWSPHGLFVVAVRNGSELVAMEPNGTIHWEKPRKQRLAFPQWSYEGFRIAYLSGDTLRVITGDGARDWGLGAADARVPPAWKPGTHDVAWVGKDGDVRIANVDDGRPPTRVRETRRIVALAWNDGELTAITGTVVAAAVGPATGHTATVARAAGRSRVYVDDRLVFSGAGVMNSVAFSPDEQWLVVGWPSGRPARLRAPAPAAAVRRLERDAAVRREMQQCTDGAARPSRARHRAQRARPADPRVRGRQSAERGEGARRRLHPRERARGPPVAMRLLQAHPTSTSG